MYAVHMCTLCVRVNVHVQSYTIDLVHESLLISVSIHLYIYIVYTFVQENGSTQFCNSDKGEFHVTITPNEQCDQSHPCMV